MCSCVRDLYSSPSGGGGRRDVVVRAASTSDTAAGEAPVSPATAVGGLLLGLGSAGAPVRITLGWAEAPLFGGVRGLGTGGALVSPPAVYFSSRVVGAREGDLARIVADGPPLTLGTGRGTGLAAVREDGAAVREAGATVREAGAGALAGVVTALRAPTGAGIPPAGRDDACFKAVTYVVASALSILYANVRKLTGPSIAAVLLK